MEFKNLSVGDKFIFEDNIDEACDVFVKINSDDCVNIRTGWEQCLLSFYRVIKLNL